MVNIAYLHYVLVIIEKYHRVQYKYRVFSINESIS